MRILSTGDWHFNAGYDDDVSASVQQIIDYVSDYKHEKVDLIVVTGDIYDRASEPGSRNLAAHYIQALANIAEVLIVRGNHDAPADLLILKSLTSSYPISVDEAPQSYYNKGIYVTSLPWITKARWQSLHPEATKEKGDETVSQMVLTYLKNLVALNPECKHILVGHLAVAGSKAQNHQQMGADGVTVGLHDLPESGLYAAMLGHIHLQQEVGNNGRFFYNGSITPLDYGETPDKWFSVLDTMTGKVEWVLLNTVYRYDVVAEWTPMGLSMTEPDPKLLKGSRVRVNLRVVGGDNVKAAREAIDGWGERVEALEVKVNPQVIPTSKVRAIDISKAEKLSDKLKQYWIATGAPDETTQSNMLDKLATLEDECSL